MKAMRDIVYKIDDYAAYIACFFIFSNMFIVAYSVVMRIFFKSPISGLTDIIGFVSGLNAVLALGYTEKGKGFIQVDFVAEYFPEILKKVFHVLLGAVNIIALTILTYRFFAYGLSTYENKNVTWVMFLPFYPIAFACCLGSALYVLTSFVHYVDKIMEWRSREQ